MKEKRVAAPRVGAHDAARNCVTSHSYSSTQESGGQSKPIFVGRRCVGEVTGTVFRKRVSASKHQLRWPRAWAFDVGSLRDAAEVGAARVEIYDTESAMTFSTSLQRIWQQGFRLNRGCGEQIALPIGDWSVLSTDRRVMAMQLQLIEV